MQEKITNSDHISKKQTIFFVDIINLILRFKKPLKYIMIISFSIGLVYAIFATKWYSSTVKILPSASGNENLMSRYSSLAAMVGINIPGVNEDRHFQYPDIIQSNFILDKILKQKYKTSSKSDSVTLFEFWGIDYDSKKPEERYKIFEKAKKDLRSNYINTFIDKKTNLLTIEVLTPDDPILTAEIANFIADELDIYNKYHRKYKTKEQRKFIERSLKDTERQMIKAEKALMYFKTKNKDLTSPENEIRLSRLETDLELQKTIYIELSNQLEIVKIEEIKETETLDILEQAVVPIRKAKPKRSLIVLFFILIGIIVSTLYIVIVISYEEIKIYFYNSQEKIKGELIESSE